MDLRPSRLHEARTQNVVGHPEEHESDHGRYKIVDTSILVDGRLVEVCEVGFLEGTLMVPRFVVRELQRISSAPGPARRARGQRGLETLDRVRRIADVRVTDEDFEGILSVDDKLIALTKRLGGALVTNDFHLERAAKLHGLRTMNFHRLAFALKPRVSPGQKIGLSIVHAGRQEGQAVGYLEDGTPVIVNNGCMIGQTLDVIVSSVLVRPTGLTCFAKAFRDNNVGSGG